MSWTSAVAGSPPHPFLLPASLTCLPLSPCLSPLSQGQTDTQQANSATPRDQAKPTSYPHADAVNVSPEIAERRADLGKDASLGQIQAFDGPAPETINGARREQIGAQRPITHSLLSTDWAYAETPVLPAHSVRAGRLCMLAVPLCLWWEARYGQDIVAQVKDHPYSILAVFVIISLASYIPIVR